MSDETPEETEMIENAIARVRALGAAAPSRRYLLNLVRTMPEWLKPGLDDDPDSIDAHVERDDEAKRAGREEERRRIVAFLRSASDHADDPDLAWVAKLIEQGAHLG